MGNMSNEYLDWMADGGACADCKHNLYGQDLNVMCEYGVESHRFERCEKYEEMAWTIPEQ